MLQEPRKRVLARRGDLAKKRAIAGKTDVEAWQIPIVNRVGLRGQDALGLLLRDPWRECLMRNGDVLRDIRNHIDALLDVLVE